MKVERSARISKCIWFAFYLCFSAELFADYSDTIELAHYSDLACGKRIRNSKVQLINLQELLNDKLKAVAKVNDVVPDHGIESPIPLLLEKAHVDGRVRRGALLRNAVRESAARGCDLVIVLDIEIVEKVMFRPQLMELKLPVSYVLVLFGSQVRNSARDPQQSFAGPDLVSDR
jgi:hypothetical protein